MMIPTATLTSVGVPQPSLTIGPIRNVPCFAGKNRAQVADRIRGALATTSCGNITDSMAPLRTPSISACRFIVRFSPTSPPTAISVKPKPSWMPVPNSTRDARSAARSRGCRPGSSW